MHRVESRDDLIVCSDDLSSCRRYTILRLLTALWSVLRRPRAMWVSSSPLWPIPDQFGIVPSLWVAGEWFHLRRPKNILWSTSTQLAQGHNGSGLEDRSGAQFQNPLEGSNFRPSLMHTLHHNITVSGEACCMWRSYNVLWHVTVLKLTLKSVNMQSLNGSGGQVRCAISKPSWRE